MNVKHSQPCKATWGSHYEQEARGCSNTIEYKYPHNVENCRGDMTVVTSAYLILNSFYSLIDNAHPKPLCEFYSLMFEAIPSTQVVCVIN